MKNFRFHDLRHSAATYLAREGATETRVHLGSRIMGAAARRAEADEVYSLFAVNSGAGILMQDGVNLFHANHGNVSATVGAILVAGDSSRSARSYIY